MNKYIFPAWALSLCVMTLVDFIIGEKAVFLNALSVWQRLIGLEVTAGNSHIYNSFGTVGELLIVLVANLLFAIIISYVLYKFADRQRQPNT
jgi:hypothetical protein